jgi:POT family proton-dependent oligopeptide transporter
LTGTLLAATPPSHSVSKTRSFSTVFLIEMWERFGFYGLQALIIFYMVQQLKLPDTVANLTWGAATTLMYVAPVAGGWVGDRFFGTRRTMMLGATVLAIGYALMVVPAYSTAFLFFTLGVIVAGSGLFKANSMNMVRLIYDDATRRIDSAATIYYMSINVGAMISLLLTPVIKSYFNAPFHGQLVWLLGSHAKSLFGTGLGWHIAFSVSCAGLLAGISNYVAMRYTLHHVGSPPDLQPLRLWKFLVMVAATIAAVLVSAVIINFITVAKAFVYIAAACAIFIYGYLIRKYHGKERIGIIIASILILEFTLFFIFNQQNSTSLSLFALRNINPAFSIFGVHLFDWDPAQLQSFNSIWLVVLSPPLAILYSHYAKYEKDISIAAKFAFGYFAIAIGFFVYAAGGYFLASHGRTTSWTIIWGYGFQSLGELLTSALGLAFIARYVPTRVSGLLLGVNLVAAGVVSYFGAMIASLASIPDSVSRIANNGALALVPSIHRATPGVLAMKLSGFRAWMTGTEAATQAAAQVHLPAYGALPPQTRQLMQQFNEELSRATMPHYVHLFFWLGVAGMGCAVITLAMLPVIRRLEGAMSRAAG